VRSVVEEMICYNIIQNYNNISILKIYTIENWKYYEVMHKYIETEKREV